MKKSKNKENPVIIEKSNFELSNERTEKALKMILEFADLITIDKQRDGDLQHKIAINSKQHLQEIYGRFSTSKKLKGMYDNIYSITTFPNEQLRLYLLSFYYTGLELFEAAKKRNEAKKIEIKEQ